MSTKVFSTFDPGILATPFEIYRLTEIPDGAGGIVEQFSKIEPAHFCYDKSGKYVENLIASGIETNVEKAILHYSDIEIKVDDKIVIYNEEYRVIGRPVIVDNRNNIAETRLIRYGRENES